MVTFEDRVTELKEEAAILTKNGDCCSSNFFARIEERRAPGGELLIAANATHPEMSTHLRDWRGGDCINPFPGHSGWGSGITTRSAVLVRSDQAPWVWSVKEGTEKVFRLS
jgi:hypothetical protein